MSVTAVHEKVFELTEEKEIARGSRLMEKAERQFCILPTITFCSCASGINNHPRLSYPFSGF